MEPVVAPEVEAYAEAHSTPPPSHLVALAKETNETLSAPQMMVGHLEGRFLEMLAFATQAKRVLEIGTFSGYSSLSMAAGLPEGSTIVTLDISEQHAEVARRHIAGSSYAGRIEVVVGPALDSVATLDGPFDLVFIDADKGNYAAYLEAVLPKLSPTGLVAVDNTLWSGRVLDGRTSDHSDPDTSAMREFNDAVVSNPELVCVQLTVRDGVTLIRRA